MTDWKLGDAATARVMLLLVEHGPMSADKVCSRIRDRREYEVKYVLGRLRMKFLITKTVDRPASAWWVGPVRFARPGVHALTELGIEWLDDYVLRQEAGYVARTIARANPTREQEPVA